MHRRHLLARFLAAALARVAGALGRASVPAPPGPWAHLPEGAEIRSECRYRVDAAILLLGVPVIRRADVGQARMSLRLARSAAARRIALEFAASSDSERACGLNRFGWIRELVLERSSCPDSATVLGIMSDSPEESVNDARRAMVPSVKQARLIAVDSHHASGETRSRVMRFDRAIEAAAWNASLAEVARRCFEEGRPPWRRTGRPGVAKPFLYSVLRALESGQASSETRFVYNEDDYRLRLERSPDGKSGDRVRGTLQNLSKRLRPLTFQFWVQRGVDTALPAHIEFQARSFLRLRLERTGPPSAPAPGETPDQERT